jgi:hypothetical protein
MQELRCYLDCGQPELSTIKPPRHRKTAKDKSFLGTPQRKICPALKVQSLTQKRNIIQRFCGVFVR